MNNEVKSGSQINDSKLNSIKSSTLYQLVCIQVKVIVIAILLTLYLQVQPTNITWYPMNIYLLVTLLLPLFSFSLYRISLQDNILHNVLTGNVFWRLLFSWKNSKARNIFPQFHQNGWDFFLKNNEGRIFIPLYFVDAFFIVTRNNNKLKLGTFNVKYWTFPSKLSSIKFSTVISEYLNIPTWRFFFFFYMIIKAVFEASILIIIILSIDN